MMWLFKKKLSLKQEIINIGYEQLSLNGYSDYELSDVEITIRYKESGCFVEIKIDVIDDKWVKEIVYASLTKDTYWIFKQAIIRAVNNLLELM